MSEHLTSNAAFADIEWDLEEAADAMAKGGFRHLVVVSDGELCGIISMRDIMRVWRPSARPQSRDVTLSFLSLLTGSFSTPAADNPTVAMVEAAYRDLGLDARYINCDVAPAALGDAVRGARAMGWKGFNCSLPHKVTVIECLDELAESAALIGAVNCVVDRDGRWIGENTDGQGFVASLRTVVDPAGRRSCCSAPAARRGRSRSSPRSRA